MARILGGPGRSLQNPRRVCSKVDVTYGFCRKINGMAGNAGLTRVTLLFRLRPLPWRVSSVVRAVES